MLTLPDRLAGLFVLADARPVQEHQRHQNAGEGRPWDRCRTPADVAIGCTAVHVVVPQGSNSERLDGQRGFKEPREASAVMIWSSGPCIANPVNKYYMRKK